MEQIDKHIFLFLSFLLLNLLFVGILYLQEGNNIFDGDFSYTCLDEKPCFNQLYKCKNDIFYNDPLCSNVDKYCVGKNSFICDIEYIQPKETLESESGFLWSNRFYIFALFGIYLYIMTDLIDKEKI